MPQRLLRRLAHHVDDHPRRLVATVVVLLALSWGLAGWSMYRTLNLGHQGRVDNCLAINNLIETIYISIGDVGGPPYIQDRFVPYQNCEDLP